MDAKVREKTRSFSEEQHKSYMEDKGKFKELRESVREEARASIKKSLIVEALAKKEGIEVHENEVIGALGNTGRSSGPHLHFEIRKLNGPIDPLPLLPAGEALTNDVDNGAIEE